MVGEGDDVIFKTGDPWFDGLEERASRGEEIRPEEFLSPEDCARLKVKSRPTPPPTEPTPPPEEFEDKYSG